MSRVGSTMHGWAGSIPRRPVKTVCGCGEKIRVGSGPKRECGPTYGPTRREIGCTLSQASPESQSDFTIIQANLTDRTLLLFLVWSAKRSLTLAVKSRGLFAFLNFN